MIARQSRINPAQFALWLSFASITMMFMAFTSAYIVRRAAGNWLHFSLPIEFLFSTGVMLLSSLSLQYSYNSYKKGIKKKYVSFLLLALVLGISFVVFQYLGWLKLSSTGIFINGNPSASFVYLITAIHVLHVLGGITALSVATFHALSLKFYVSEKRRFRFQLVLQYWHFVDILWIYLLIFFLLQR